MHQAQPSRRWDDEYRTGRYVGEEPVAFVDDIVAAARAHRPAQDVGLYIGCGNGRNYVPLVEAGLDLIGLDVSARAIEQLAERVPDRVDRLVHGDLAALPTDLRFGTIVGIQVFQHGREAEAHGHVRAAIERLVPGGLFCIRVNAVGTQLEYDHEIVETNEAGGFTIEYRSGPKQGLFVHFFARSELEALLGELEPVLPLRRARTHRPPPASGYWDQWEGIWRASSSLTA